MSRTHKLFFAISKGVKPASIKRYIGYADCSIEAVNPSAKELSALYGNDIKDEPVYLKEIEVGQDKHKVLQATVTFITKTIVDGTDLLNKVSFNIRKEFRMNTDKTKLQVIDNYGNACWVTQEQFKKKEIPMYSNGPAGIDSNYRPAYWGEENFISFLKTAINIPSVFKFKQSDGKYYRDGFIDDKSIAECSLDWDKIFKGDFSDLKDVPQMTKDNDCLVTLLFGIRKTDDNKIYQSVFTEKFYRAGKVKVAELQTEVNSRQSAGAYPNTTFEVTPLHEYVEKPSALPASSPFEAPASYDPFASNTPFETSASTDITDDLPFGM